VFKNGFFKYLCGFLVAALLLWWVLRGVDGRAIWEQLKQASVVGIAIAAVLNAGHNVFRVWRWRALLEPIRPAVAFRPMFTAVILGYMTTWVIPGRLGELVRPLVLSARQPVPLGPCIGTVVADRILDAVTIVFLFAVGLMVTPLEGEAAEYTAQVRTASLLLAAGAVVLLAVMLAVTSAGGRLSSWIERRKGLLRWIGRTTLSLASGMKAFRSPRLVLRIIAHSGLAWLTIALATWAGVLSCGTGISFGTVLIIMPMLALGVAVPTPGGVGTYHGAMMVGLMLFGVSQTLAVSAALLMHAICIVPIVVLGMLLLWIERISWKEFVSAARQFKRLGDGSERPTEAATLERMS
jgi:uncharacterized protein (TIRG00374 family)